jgi:hypothetical protein
MHKLIKRLNSITNDSFSRAINLMKSNNFRMAVPLLKEAMSDPEVTADATQTNIVKFYLQSAYVGIGDYESLSVELDQTLLAEVNLKAPEPRLLQAIKNLYKAYIQQNEFLKALYITSQTDEILKKKNFTNHFKKEIALMRATVQIIENEIDEELIATLTEMTQSAEEDFTLAMVHNNLGVAKLIWTEGSLSEAASHFIKAVCILEALKVEDEDFLFTLGDKEDFGKDFRIEDEDREQVNYIAQLTTYLQSPRKKSDKFLRNFNSAIPLANLVDVYMRDNKKAEGIHLSMLGLNKINKSQSSLMDHRLFFYVYKYKNPNMDQHTAEKYLLGAIMAADANNSALRELLLSIYEDLLLTQKRHYEAFQVNQLIFDSIRSGDIYCKEKQFISPAALMKDYVLIPDYKLYSNII